VQKAERRLGQQLLCHGWLLDDRAHKLDRFIHNLQQLCIRHASQVATNIGLLAMLDCRAPRGTRYAPDCGSAWLVVGVWCLCCAVSNGTHKNIVVVFVALFDSLLDIGVLATLTMALISCPLSTKANTCRSFAELYSFLFLAVSPSMASKIPHALRTVGGHALTDDSVTARPCSPVLYHFNLV
jgi:hypothetical protein